MEFSLTEAEADLIRSRQAASVKIEEEVRAATEKSIVAREALGDVILGIARMHGAPKSEEFDGFTLALKDGTPVLTLAEKLRTATPAAG